MLCDKGNNKASIDIRNLLGFVSDRMSLGALSLQASVCPAPIILNETWLWASQMISCLEPCPQSEMSQRLPSYGSGPSGPLIIMHPHCYFRSGHLAGGVRNSTACVCPRWSLKQTVPSLAVAGEPVSLLPDSYHTPCSPVSQSQLVKELKGQDTSKGELRAQEISKQPAHLNQG